MDMQKKTTKLSEQISRRFSSGIWIISVVGLLNWISWSMSLPFMALYLYQERGVSMAWVGVIMLVCGLSSVAAQLAGGAITDKVGRRPFLIGTVSLGIVLYLIMALLIGMHSPVLAIAAAFLLARAVQTMQRPAIQAIVVDLAKPERLAESYSLLRVSTNIGFAAGPALGGFLVLYLNFAWLFGAAGLIGIIALVLVILFFKESSRIQAVRIDFTAILKAGQDRNLLVFSLLSLLVFLTSGQMASTLSVYTVSFAGFSEAQYGFLLTLNGLIIVAVQYPLTRLLGRFPYLSLTLGAFFYGCGYLILTWVGPYGLALFSMTIITFGEMSISPTASAMVGEMATAEWRGRYMAFFGAMETLGFSIGPLIGGILLNAFPGHPLAVWGPLSSMAFVAALAFSRVRFKKDKKGAPR
jgi:predicted MFS family arabinose efflux permease